MHSAYVIRMQNPEGRYWTNVVGNLPSPEDADFVELRSDFLDELVKYIELKEVRLLRRQFAANMMSDNHKVGEVSKLDLTPEAAALGLCLVTLHKKLKI
jgi:hypothetical protein